MKKMSTWNNWQVRAGRGGVCDFRANYDFYFKWLTNKVMSCFIIRDHDKSERTKSINWDYFKLNCILDGAICITDFNGKLYACIGNRGGEPDEYYVPTVFTIANPILGSKQVKIGVDGVVIYNTKIDQFMFTGNTPIFETGLYDLIAQTSALLADNIISINCCQINARVTTFFTADSTAQAVAGEEILKKQYAGKPYQILKSNILEKITVNPVNSSAQGQNITELVELHNYIIANFFQSIGIKSNNIMKRERLIRDEIESQDDFLQVSVLEILSSWQAGLDEVNAMYGTSFIVELNPVLIAELMQQLDGTAEQEEAAAAGDGEPEAEQAEEAIEEAAAEPEEDAAEDQSEEAEEEAAAGDGEPEAEQAEEAAEEDTAEDVIDEIEDKEEVIEDLVDLINDKEESETEEGENDEPEPTKEDPEADLD